MAYDAFGVIGLSLLNLYLYFLIMTLRQLICGCRYQVQECSINCDSCTSCSAAAAAEVRNRAQFGEVEDVEGPHPPVCHHRHGCDHQGAIEACHQGSGREGWGADMRGPAEAEG